MERKTRFELATPSLARRCSTTEPLPLEPCGPLKFYTCCFEQSRLKVPWYTHQPKSFEPGVFLVLSRNPSSFFSPSVSHATVGGIVAEPRIRCSHKRKNDIRAISRCLPTSFGGSARRNWRSARCDTLPHGCRRPGHAYTHGYSLHAEVVGDRAIPVTSSRILRPHALGSALQLLPPCHFPG
jgi:hypothetical protein